MTPEEIQKGDTIKLIKPERDCTLHKEYKASKVTRDYIEFSDDYQEGHQLDIDYFEKVAGNMKEENKKLFVTSEIQSYSRWVHEANAWLIKDSAIDKLAVKLINIISPKHEYKVNDQEVEDMALMIDSFIKMYLKDGKAGTYSLKLRQYIVEILNR